MMGAGEGIFMLAAVGAGAYYLYAKDRQRNGLDAEPVTYTVQRSGPDFASVAGAALTGLGGLINESSGGRSIFGGGHGATTTSSGGGGLGGFLGGLFGVPTAPNPSPSPLPAPPQPSLPPVINPITQGVLTSSIGLRLFNDLQDDFQFTPQQAAGVVGNLQFESAGFTTLQEMQPMQYVGGQLVPSQTARGGYGYAQWTGSRRRDFEAWVAARGLDITSYEANYGFLRHELTNTWERRAVTRVKRTTTTAEAAEVFMNSYLRPGIPHLSQRIHIAEGYA